MSDIVKIRVIMVVLALFCFSAFQSCQELRYGIWSKRAVAQVTNINHTTYTRRGQRTNLAEVHYSFADTDGKTRSEDDTVSVDSPSFTASMVKIQFIPHALGASRLDFPRNKLFVYIFLVSIAAMLILAGRFWIEYKRDNP